MFSCAVPNLACQIVAVTAPSRLFVHTQNIGASSFQLMSSEYVEVFRALDIAFCDYVVVPWFILSMKGLHFDT